MQKVWKFLFPVAGYINYNIDTACFNKIYSIQITFLEKYSQPLHNNSHLHLTEQKDANEEQG